MDHFAVFRRFRSVERVSNLYPSSTVDEPLNFLFFICPKTKGFRLNPNATGLTTRYVVGNPPSTKDRLRRVGAFLEEVTQVGLGVSVKAIFAAADSLILFPIAVPPPPCPQLDVEVLSNYEVVREYLPAFWDLYRHQPWQKVPERLQEMERERLRTFFWKSFPENIFRDFVRRVFAGFALDGLVIRAGHFGQNPVLLGVESPGVPVLQNAALPREKWLPVIQLR